ncbi:MAG: hypothetical protein ACYTA3_04150 [Planctomycetota bacterium]
MAEALGTAKRDLGPDAVILETRTFKRGGLLGVGRRTIFELTATSNDRATWRARGALRARLQPLALNAQRPRRPTATDRLTNSRTSSARSVSRRPSLRNTTGKRPVPCWAATLQGRAKHAMRT